MKNSARIALGLLLLATVTTAPSGAVPVSSGQLGRNYLVSAADLTRWSGGILGSVRKRDVEVERFDYTLKSTRYLIYVGYDFMSWATAYGIGGRSVSKMGSGAYENASAEIGGGVRFNILEHEILSPTLVEDMIRINCGVQYTMSGTDWRGTDLDWGELYGWLTLSLINELDGNKLFVPWSIALYGGPIYSDFFSDVDANETLGFTAGLEVLYTDRVSLHAGVEHFDEQSFAGGVQIRF